MEIKLDPAELKPIVEAVVCELLEKFQQDPDRIAYSEAEGANLLGVTTTTLRDERLRGRIEASLVGRKIRYTKQNLLDYLASRQWEPK